MWVLLLHPCSLCLHLILINLLLRKFSILYLLKMSPEMQVLWFVIQWTQIYTYCQPCQMGWEDKNFFYSSGSRVLSNMNITQNSYCPKNSINSVSLKLCRLRKKTLAKTSPLSTPALTVLNVWSSMMRTYTNFIVVNLVSPLYQKNSLDVLFPSLDFKQSHSYN